jgi:hypothetical protein
MSTLKTDGLNFLYGFVTKSRQSCRGHVTRNYFFVYLGKVSLLRKNKKAPAVFQLNWLTLVQRYNWIVFSLMCLHSHSTKYLQTSGSTFQCLINSTVLLVRKQCTAQSVKCGRMKTAQFDPVLAYDEDLIEFRKTLKILRILGSSRKGTRTDIGHCKFDHSFVCQIYVTSNLIIWGAFFITPSALLDKPAFIMTVRTSR